MMGSAFAKICLAALAVGAAIAASQAQTPDIAPVNSGANPYRTIRNWGTLPPGRPWGAANGVAIDRDGKSVWTADRCGTAQGCVGTNVDPIQKFDENGNRLTSFGGGMFVWPHGLHVDRGGNIWVADSRRPERRRAREFSGREEQGQRGGEVQPGGTGAAAAGPVRHGGQSARAPHRSDQCPDRRERRHLRGREPHRCERSQSDRAHLGVRQDGEISPHHRQDRNRAGRIPHAACHGVRLARAADRRRPAQSPHPDPDQGRKYIGEYREFSRVSGLAIDANDTHLCGGFGIGCGAASGLAQGNPHRESEGRQGDDVHSAASDEYAGRRHGRGHRARRRGESVHGGSHRAGHFEICEGIERVALLPRQRMYCKAGTRTVAIR